MGGLRYLKNAYRPFPCLFLPFYARSLFHCSLGFFDRPLRAWHRLVYLLMYIIEVITFFRKKPLKPYIFLFQFVSFLLC